MLILMNLVTALLFPIILTVSAFGAGEDRLDELAKRNQRAAAILKLSREGVAALPVLISALEDGDPEVRAAAARGLAGVGDPGATSALIGTLKDPVPPVRVEAAKALGAIRDKSAGPALVAALTDVESTVRMFAARSLGAIGFEGAIEPLLQLVQDKNRTEPERRVAIVALGILKARLAIWPLLMIVSDPSEDPKTEAAAVHALGHIGDPKVGDTLTSKVGSPEARVRYSAVVALGKLRSEHVVVPLVRVLRDVNEMDATREAAIQALGNIGSEEATLALLEELEHGDEYLAMRAAQTLAKMKEKRAIALINDRAARSKDWWIVRNLQAALTRLAGDR